MRGRACERTRVRAFHGAIKLLSCRSRTHYELAQRLRGKGFSEEVVEDVAAELVERGLLDDARLARDIVCNGQIANKSRSRIYSELRRRGISRELAEESIQSFFDPEREREAAALLLEKYLPLSPGSAAKGEIEKAVTRLSARGFSHSAIADVLSGIRDDGDYDHMSRFLDTDSQLS